MIKTLTKIFITAALVLAIPATAFAAPKPKVQFSQSAYAVAENGGHATITVWRKGNAKRLARTVSVNYATSNGTAVAGVDYQDSHGTLTFTPGVTSQTFDVPVINKDNVDTGPRTVNLKLSSPVSDVGRAVLAYPSTAVLVIADDDSSGSGGGTVPPTFQMAAPSDVVGEPAAGTTSLETVYVIRSGDLSTSADVNYATTSGTAVDGTDFNGVNNGLTFPAQSTDPTASIIQPVTVTLRNNPATSPATRDFSFGLSIPSGSSSTLGSPSSETVTIVNADGTPTLQWSAPSYSVAENGGSVRLTVFAAGNLGSEVDVDYATQDGSAIAGVNYTAASDTLAFIGADGDVAQSFDVPVMGDGLPGDKYFTAVLSNPTGGGVIGTPGTATVNVLNVDAAPTNNGGAGNPGDGSSGTPAPAGGTGGDQGGSQLVLGARQSACGLTVTAAKKQKLLKKRALILKLRSNQACKVSLSATIKQLIKKRSRAGHSARALRFNSKKVSLSLQPGKAATVKVKFTKKTLKAIKKALATRKRLVATVVVIERAGSAPAHKRSLKITVRR